MRIALGCHVARSVLDVDLGELDLPFDDHGRRFIDDRGRESRVTPAHLKYPRVQTKTDGHKTPQIATDQSIALDRTSG
jgi:hypothetical protein